jgi:hypothetical protein
MKKIITAALAAGMLLGSAASASALAEGDFIGKGEVQQSFGWNNKQLQDDADKVLVVATTTTEWTCSKEVELGNGGTNEIVQQRSTTTTVSATTETRLRNQVTGFYVGEVLRSSTDGPAVGTCPADQSGFVYDGNAETGDSTLTFSLS